MDSGQFLNTVHHEYDISGFSVLENLNPIRLLIRFTTKVYARGLAGVAVSPATWFSRTSAQHQAKFEQEP